MHYNFNTSIQNAWYKKSIWLYFLTPISGLYRLIISLKSFCYRIGFFHKIHFPVPVIIVGNLTVGGTGKTPLLIELANYLSQQGYHPGVVSRGHGGHAKHFPIKVTAQSDAYEVGDEPVLIARRTNCPVVVDPSRPNAVNWLLENNRCDIILSDDGLQHTALARDIEIVVIDGKRRFGNECCLPAGPLREPLHRLKSVDFLVTNQGVPHPGEWGMRLVAGEICSLTDTEKKLDIRLLSEETSVHAVAGIGNPQRFFDQLRTLGFSVIEHPFRDHHHYSPKDIDFGHDAVIIMTEKDAVKCEKFADHRHYYLPVVAELDLGLKNQLLSCVRMVC